MFEEESIIGYKNRNHFLRTFRGFFKNHIKFSRSNYQDAGKGSAVCSSLHCGTRYLIAVLARPTAQVPRWAGNVSGGPGSIPGRFWRTGVPSFRRCSAEPLHFGSVKYRDVVRPLHRPLHCRVRGWRRLKKKTTRNVISQMAHKCTFPF